MLLPSHPEGLLDQHIYPQELYRIIQLRGGLAPLAMEKPLIPVAQVPFVWWNKEQSKSYKMGARQEEREKRIQFLKTMPASKCPLGFCSLLRKVSSLAGCTMTQAREKHVC